MRLEAPSPTDTSASLPFHLAPWEGTFACGVIKIMLAMSALALPILLAQPLARSVGWILLAGGLSELALSWSGRRSWVGRVTFGSGAVTVVLGAIFIKGPWTGLFPLALFVMVWLLLRGLVSLDAAFLSRESPAANWVWLSVRGAADLGLGLLLLLGSPLALFTVAVFGETREVLATFCVVLAVSFFTGGATLMAIALAQKRRHLADPFLSGFDHGAT